MRAFGSYLPHCDGTNSPPLTPPKALRRGRGGGRLGPLGLATPARIRFGALPPALPAISEDMANRRARRDEMTAQLNEDVFLAGVVNEAHALGLEPTVSLTGYWCKTVLVLLLLHTKLGSEGTPRHRPPLLDLRSPSSESS